MPSLKEQTTQLAAMLELHLLQEYPSGYRLPTSFETCEFFRKEAKTLQTKRPPITAPKVEAPPPIEIPPTPKKKTPTLKEAPPKVQKEPKKAAIELSTVKTAEKAAYHDIAQEIQKRLPHIKILDRVPDDTEAKRIKNSWKEGIEAPEVVIVGNSATSSQETTLLHNIAHALIRHKIDAKVIDEESAHHFGGWETLSEHERVQFFVGKCPIECGKPSVPLEPLSTYLREPLRKSDLWNALLKKMAVR